MNLRIAFREYTALRDRCEVATARTSRGDPDYEEGAVVPDREWQPLNPGLAQRLRPDDSTPDSTLVELLRLPEVDPDELTAMATGLSWPDRLTGRATAEYLGYVVSPPNTLTTTVNPTSGRRIGLHVDNWDRLPSTTRHQARRRLCFNFGPGTRYLLLGVVDVTAICRTLYPDHEARCPHTDDVRRYVAEGPPLRCLRIRLDPGDGYIAPTELQPHEGSTEDQPEPSTAAFWLGHWQQGTLGSAV